MDIIVNGVYFTVSVEDAGIMNKARLIAKMKYCKFVEYIGEIKLSSKKASADVVQQIKNIITYEDEHLITAKIIGDSYCFLQVTIQNNENTITVVCRLVNNAAHDYIKGIFEKKYMQVKFAELKSQNDTLIQQNMALKVQLERIETMLLKMKT
jgi:hypothetical protein